MGERIFFVYILTNLHKTTLYTGVTNDLYRRLLEHKHGDGKSFTKRYRVVRLVYFEIYREIEDAIAREKQIKGGSRQKKVDLINAFNPEWIDLGPDMEP